MKKLLLTLIVALTFSGSIFAQDHPETAYPGFYDPAYLFQASLYSSIMINGVPVDVETANWEMLEVCAFVDIEGVEIQRSYGMWLTDQYVIEYGELFPTLNADAVYYTDGGDVVHFKMHNHATGEDYTATIGTIWDDGTEVTVITGEDHWEGFDDPDHPLLLNFTSSSSGYTKHIQGYSADYTEDNPNDHYYLIASPLANENGISPEDIEGMTDGEYDLYYFNQSVDGDGKEWINFKDETLGGFDIVNGKGYLYAHNEDIDLTFTGDAYEGDGTVTLSYVDGVYWEGWNLVGNPFTVEAYANRDYYALQNGKELELKGSADPVGAMEGIFVLAENENDTEMTFSTTAPNKRSSLSLNVSRANRVLDRTVVRFGGERVLPKFQLRPNSTKVYIPMEGKDYAVVSAEGVGEMPVSFKAEKSGSYTISAKGEEVDFTYLHLIDNMTGADIDLLTTPSYSFEATTTDYAQRFRLLFATGSSEDGDTFGFINGAGNLSIYGIEGEATLQVMDVNGRVLSTETFSGSYEKSLNVAAGIYMLRLTNGDNVRVQKMVIR